MQLSKRQALDLVKVLAVVENKSLRIGTESLYDFVGRLEDFVLDQTGVGDPCHDCGTHHRPHCDKMTERASTKSVAHFLNTCNSLGVMPYELLGKLSLSYARVVNSSSSNVDEEVRLSFSNMQDSHSLKVVSDEPPHFHKLIPVKEIMVFDAELKVRDDLGDWHVFDLGRVPNDWNDVLSNGILYKIA